MADYAATGKKKKKKVPWQAGEAVRVWLTADFFYFKSSLALHNNKLCQLSTHKLRNNEHWFTELNCIETFEWWQSGVCFELEFNLCLYRPAQVRQMEN